MNTIIIRLSSNVDLWDIENDGDAAGNEIDSLRFKMIFSEYGLQKILQPVDNSIKVAEHQLLNGLFFGINSTSNSLFSIISFILFRIFFD